MTKLLCAYNFAPKLLFCVCYSLFFLYMYIAWAIKRGFHTAKTSRPDVYRAANNILRMALDGRTICLALYPPNYTKEKGNIYILC